MIDPWDQKLSEMLASYMDVTPRPGMEARVLARVRGAGRRPVLGKWGMLGAALGGVCSTALFEVWPPSLPPAPTVKMASPQVAVVDAPRRELPVRAVRTRTSVFPRPSSLTEEERLLMALVRDAPERAVGIFERRSEKGAEPIRIEELVIAPLVAEEKERGNE